TRRRQEFRQGAEYRASPARMRSSSMTATRPMQTLRKARMRRVLLASIALGLVASSAAAQDRKGIRFWNLTLYTITTFQMSPAGKDSWGHPTNARMIGMERLTTTNACESLASNPDATTSNFSDKTGRVCIVRNVEVKEGAVVSIEERQLTDC